MKFSKDFVSYLLTAGFLFNGYTLALPAQSPHELEARAGSSPGIGVELEWRNGILKNPDPRAKEARYDSDAISKIKGSKINVKDVTTFTNEWKLTAEHSPDIDNNGLEHLVFEWIVLGEVVKLDKSKNVLGDIAEEIRTNLVSSGAFPNMAFH